MLIEWTSHLKDPEEKSSFENEIHRSKDVLDRLKSILDKQLLNIDYNEIHIDTYSTPNWSERQAHKNGNREMLMYLRKLVDLDQQRKTK